MDNGFRVKATLPAEPKAIYKAWLSGAEHTAMTGGAATASTEVGGRFTAWDGYISGRNISLKPHWCIVQFWRTTRFSPDDPDSRLELCIHPKGSGSEVLLIHTGLPADQVERYRSGWIDHYFEPMKKHFAARKPAKRSARKTVKNRKKASKKKTAKKKSARKKKKTTRRSRPR